MQTGLYPDSRAARRLLQDCRMGLVAITGAILWMYGGLAAAQTVWPTIVLPKDVKAFDIGEQVTVNGLPMRMKGFVSNAQLAQLANWFRQSLGKPMVENTLANKLILGRAQGEHYLTVQLEPAGMGTRGLIAVTQLKAAYDNRFETQAATERWLARLPSGSRLIRRMTSDDADKIAQYVVITNGHSEDLNRDRLQDLMREAGLELEREAAAGSKTSSQLPGAIAGGKTLFFKGHAKEAIAVISQNGAGQTAIVINIVTQMERLK